MKALLTLAFAVLCLLTALPAEAQRYRGQFSANPFDPDSIANPFGRHGSAFAPAPRAPLRLYDRGQYRGCLNCSPYDPDSVRNEFGRYGSPYSPESVNNEYGAGNPYAPTSPRNPFGRGWSIWED